MKALRLLYQAWNLKPTAVTIPIFMLPIGVAAIVLGDNASRAFANLGGGSMVRVMGAAMVLGASLVVISLLRDDALIEVIGLTLAALGAAIYGCGVMLGLGSQGLVAGLGYLAITVAFLGRIRLLVCAARTDDNPRTDQLR